ncbi:MAG: pilus assembly protein PilM [Pirellulaceae bacterium]
MTSIDPMSEFNLDDAGRQDRSKRPAAMEPDEPREEAQDIAAARITCTRCQKVNPHGHRFCRSCGSALWRTCSGCDGERPVDETFCALCGANLADFERKLVQDYSARLSDLEQMAASQQFWDAEWGLRALLAAPQPPGADKIRETAASLLDRVITQREEWRVRCTGHLERGRELLASRRYGEAAQEFNLIPARARDEDTNKLLAEANAKAAEITVLKARVRAHSGIRFEERMSSIAQLLKLQPDDALVTRWAVQARDQIVQVARKRLQEHQYRSAVELLTSVPEQVADTTVTGLLRHASELDFLWSEMEFAPTITETTLRTAQRLLKLAPGNEQAQAQYRDMVRQFQSAGGASATSSLVWATSPEQPFVGLPVHAYTAPTSLHFADEETRRRFAEQPGQFGVASGLALQSVGRAQVTTNLLPVRNMGVLGMLRVPLWERPAKTGWGLDLSVSGLKAVRITLDEEDRPAITRVVQFPHRLALTHPAAASIKKALLLETLKQFVTEQGVNASSRVAISWPAVQSFVRFLRLPPVEGRKWRDMLELETRQQIPMPLDQVTRDTFSFPRLNWASSLDQMLTLLIAARTRDVEDHLEIFQQAGIDVHAVQCDAVALHNWLYFDCLTKLPEVTVDRRAEGYVVVDVGAETTNVLFSFRNAIWFRSVRPAGDDLVTAFVQRFQLTREVAAELVRNPAKAKRMSEVHAEACHVFQELAAQIEGCLAEFRRTASLGALREMILVGGGGQSPGLLRYLRNGR